MIILGYLLAILMGLTLGMIGAGGSILTVPILVYFFDFPAITATTYSLLIVGITALFGAFSYYKKQQLNFRAALIFAIPASSLMFLTRTFIIPKLPQQIFHISIQNLMMLLFSVIMAIASYLMLKDQNSKNLDQKKQDPQLTNIIFGSSAIGVLTAFIGAGGGFLIVPTLIKLFKLKAKEAVGTSLAIIAANSLIGFKASVIFGNTIDWKFLGILSLSTIFGMLVGSFLAKRFNDQKLKQIFSYFVAVMAILIFYDQLTKIL